MPTAKAKLRLLTKRSSVVHVQSAKQTRKERIAALKENSRFLKKSNMNRELHIKIEVHQARHLKGEKDSLYTYVKCEVPKVKSEDKTTCQPSEQPTWYENIFLKVPYESTNKNLDEVLDQSLTFTLKQSSERLIPLMEKKEILGEFEIDLRTIFLQPHNKVENKWIQLLNPDDYRDVAGYLKFSAFISLEDDLSYVNPVENPETDVIQSNLLHPAGKGIKTAFQDLMSCNFKIYYGINFPRLDKQSGKEPKIQVRVTYREITAETGFYEVGNANPVINRELKIFEQPPGFFNRAKIEILDKTEVLAVKFIAMDEILAQATGADSQKKFLAAPRYHDFYRSDLTGPAGRLMMEITYEHEGLIPKNHKSNFTALNLHFLEKNQDLIEEIDACHDFKKFAAHHRISAEIYGLEVFKCKRLSEKKLPMRVSLNVGDFTDEAANTLYSVNASSSNLMKHVVPMNDIKNKFKQDILAKLNSHEVPYEVGPGSNIYFIPKNGHGTGNQNGKPKLILDYCWYDHNIPKSLPDAYIWMAIGNDKSEGAFAKIDLCKILSNQKYGQLPKISDYYFTSMKAINAKEVDSDTIFAKMTLKIEVQPPALPEIQANVPRPIKPSLDSTESSANGPQPLYDLTGHIFKCQNMMAADSTGFSDPYPIIYFEGRQVRLDPKISTTNPAFEKSFTIPNIEINRDVKNGE